MPFAHREAELEELRNWTVDRGRHVTVALLTGGPGRGKSRLARRLCQEVMDENDPWLAGRLSAEGLSDPSHFKPLMAWKGPLLLVVDYAERGASVAMVKALVEAALDARDARKHHQTRILLIARSEGDWWRQLQAAFRNDLDSPFDDTRALRRELPPLAAADVDAEAEFARAHAAFRDRMGDNDPRAPAAAPWLRGATAADALDIHMAALLAAFGDTPAAETAGETAEESITRQLFAREEESWTAALHAHDLRGSGLKPAMPRLVAWASTVGADTDRHTLAARLAHWPPLAGDALALTRQSLATALTRLYPGADDGFAGLRPDRLTTFLTRQVATADIERAVPGLSREAVAGLLRHLAWHAQRYGDDASTDKLRTAIRAAGTEGLLAAFDVAAAEGDPVGPMAARVLEEAADAEAAETIYRNSPPATVSLRELAAVATRILAAAAAAPEARAGYHNDLANRLSDLGHREQALAAAKNAVDSYRELARQRPDAFKPNLAVSLMVLANAQDALGSDTAALESDREAIATLRPQFLRHPAAFVQWMTAMCRQYIDRCERAGVAPDDELLGPIAEALQALPDDGGASA